MFIRFSCYKVENVFPGSTLALRGPGCQELSLGSLEPRGMEPRDSPRPSQLCVCWKPRKQHFAWKKSERLLLLQPGTLDVCASRLPVEEGGISRERLPRHHREFGLCSVSDELLQSTRAVLNSCHSHRCVREGSDLDRCCLSCTLSFPLLVNSACERSTLHLAWPCCMIIMGWEGTSLEAAPAVKILITMK